MAARGQACACYIPIPGLAALLAKSHPQDRLLRFHARQATVVILFAYVMLILFGLLAKGFPDAAPAVGPAAGAVLAITLVAILVGVAGAAMGRFTRLRPFWDLVAR